MAQLEPYFPKSHGRPRVDDRRVLSGIVRQSQQVAVVRCNEGLRALQARPEQLLLGSAILGVAFDHGVELNEKLSHGTDDRKFERFTGFAQPTGSRDEMPVA